MLFSKLNLHFVTPNQISAVRKINLQVTNSISLVFLPPEMQRGPKQTKVYYIFFFLLRLKRNESQTFKSKKSLFSSVYVIGTTCSDLCFLFHVTTGRHYFSLKFIIY